MHNKTGSENRDIAPLDLSNMLAHGPAVLGLSIFSTSNLN